MFLRTFQSKCTFYNSRSNHARGSHCEVDIMLIMAIMCAYLHYKDHMSLSFGSLPLQGRIHVCISFLPINLHT